MRWYAAPMEGVTGYLYRSLHHRYFPGADKYGMPFFSPTQNHTIPPRALRELSPEHNAGIPAVPQLLTRRADDFLWAAGELAAMGYREVNLNLGCPSGTVVAKGKGAGFLVRPEELERFLEAVFAAVPVAVSVKTRLGISDEDEFVRILEIYNRFPISELTIHARAQKDQYRGAVRMDAFARALGESCAPVCYNGDLRAAKDCRALQARFPRLRAAMVGRGLIADPALIRKAQGGQGADKRTLEAFLQELYAGYCRDFASRENAMLRMKEIWSYQISLFRDDGNYAKKLRKTDNPQEFETLVTEIFQKLTLLPDAADNW